MTERTETEALWEQLRQAWGDIRSLEERLLIAEAQKADEESRVEISRAEETLRMPMGKVRGCMVQCFEQITRYRTHDVRQCFVVAIPGRTSEQPPKAIQVTKEDTWEKAVAAAEKWLAETEPVKRELSEEVAAVEKRQGEKRELSEEELAPLAWHVQR